MLSDEARNVASEIKANEYYETSGKTNTRVNEVFEAAARLAFEVPSQTRRKKCVII